VKIKLKYADGSVTVHYVRCLNLWTGYECRSCL